MKYKIGVFGSAEDNKEELYGKAREIGRELAKRDVIVITGAGAGLPYVASEEAAKRGADVWGYAPHFSDEDQLAEYKDHDLKIYKKLFYVPKDYKTIFPLSDITESNVINVLRKYRNVMSTANCDAGIIISGRWGSLNEFTDLYDMGKVIGVLTGTGGVADEIETLMTKITKKSKAKVIYNSSPSELVKDLISQL